MGIPVYWGLSGHDGPPREALRQTRFTISSIQSRRYELARRQRIGGLNDRIGHARNIPLTRFPMRPGRQNGTTTESRDFIARMSQDSPLLNGDSRRRWSPFVQQLVQQATINEDTAAEIANRTTLHIPLLTQRVRGDIRRAQRPASPNAVCETDDSTVTLSDAGSNPDTDQADSDSVPDHTTDTSLDASSERIIMVESGARVRVHQDDEIN